jgi:putative FmdB family regulatory protein
MALAPIVAWALASERKVYMPTYVYQCDTCGMTFERRQTMTAPPLVDCPECEGHVQRLIQPVGIVFKGSGFYVTDHRAKPASNDKKDKKQTSTDSTESAA